MSDIFTGMDAAIGFIQPRQVISVWPDHGSGEYHADGSPYWIVSLDEIVGEEALSTETISVHDTEARAIESGAAKSRALALDLIT